MRVQVELDMPTWDMEAPDAESVRADGDLLGSLLQQLEEVADGEVGEDTLMING